MYDCWERKMPEYFPIRNVEQAVYSIAPHTLPSPQQGEGKVRGATIRFFLTKGPTI
jgi:hypothetical protein